MTTALIGYGSHGSDIEAIFRLYGRGQLVIYDEDPTVAEPPPVPMDIPYFLGDNYRRRQMAERLGGRGAPPLHESHKQYLDCVFAPGVVIAPGVSIGHHVTLGLHTHINYGSALTRCFVGDYVTVAPGVIMCGDITVHDDAFIGAGAVLSDRVTVGRGATVGAGAVVPPCTHIPAGEVWVGVPAKPLRTAA